MLRINFIKYILQSLCSFVFTQTWSEETHRSARRSKSIGFMCQVCMFFAHEALSHFMVRYLTAGRDSTVVMTASFHISLLVENIYNEYQTLFDCSFPKRIRQSVEELILQPDQHHRVVFMQPPSSLDDGLENQSVKFLFLSFNCPTKALMFLILTLLERLRALCLSSTSNKTLLRLKAGSTPQDVSTSTVAFAAVSLDIAKTFIARSPRSFESTPKD